MQTGPTFDDQSKSKAVGKQTVRARPIVRSAQSRHHRVLQQVDADGTRARGADYVTIPVAASMTGYSPKAIRRKIESGVWLEGREFRRAPDGHVLISVKGYELWVERGRA
jgi:hypothetical protein